MIKKTFPCPYCARLGEDSTEQGECIDVGDSESGSIMLQVAPDICCGCCDGTGYVEVGSEAHFDIKVGSVNNFVAKTFGEDFIDNLPAEQYRDFWKSLDFYLIIKDAWRSHNKQLDGKRDDND